MKTGLVMEGGAMRGLFTAGVVDVFLENDINFEGAVGISAGATFGCNIKSKQHGRALRYNKNFCNDKRYMSYRNLIKTGDIFEKEFCYRVLPYEIDIFDTETFLANPMDFYVGVTNVETGKAEFQLLTDGLIDDIEWIRASASMPLAANIVEIEGKKFLDGGCADSIPLKFMEGQGYERNVVILTQPKGYKKGPNRLMPLMKVKYRKYPEFIRCLAERHIMYNGQTRYVREQELKGKALVIRPPQDLDIGRTEHDPEELQRVYDIGRETALAMLPQIKAFMEGKTPAGSIEVE